MKQWKRNSADSLLHSRFFMSICNFLIPEGQASNTTLTVFAQDSTRDPVQKVKKGKEKTQ